MSSLPGQNRQQVWDEQESRQYTAYQDSQTRVDSSSSTPSMNYTIDASHEASSSRVIFDGTATATAISTTSNGSSTNRSDINGNHAIVPPWQRSHSQSSFQPSNKSVDAFFGKSGHSMKARSVSATPDTRVHHQHHRAQQRSLSSFKEESTINIVNTHEEEEGNNPTHSLPATPPSPKQQQQQPQLQSQPSKPIDVATRQRSGSAMATFAEVDGLVLPDTSGEPTPAPPMHTPPRVKHSSSSISTTITTANPSGHTSTRTTMTSNNESPILACPICGQLAETLATLNHHLDAVHPESPSPASTVRRSTRAATTTTATTTKDRRAPALPPRQSGSSHRKSLSGSALLSRGNTSNGASSWLWGSVNGDDDRASDTFLAEGEEDDEEDDDDFDPAQAVMGWLKQAQKKFVPAKNKLTQLAVRAINSANGTQPSQSRQGGDGALLNHLYSLSDPPQLAFQQPIQPGDIIDQDEENWIMRAHWQPVTEGATCNAPGCAKQRGALTLLTGKEHCRSCGKLFCQVHCMCALKLNEKARHDPQRGRWCRVCESCFEIYQGAHDRQGLIQSKTAEFLMIRQETLVRTNLEANRLEKRLEKLAQAYADPSNVVGPVMQRIKPQQQIRKAIDQAIVTWDDDATVDECPLCGDTFKALVNRKHHCRLCGRVVCGQAHCSQVHTVTVNGDLDVPLDDPFTVGEVRLCVECNRTVVRRREKRFGQSKPVMLMDLYESLLVHRSIIRDILPQFNQLIQTLKNESNNPDHASTQQHVSQQATQMRKQLMDSFAQYDLISKQIGRLPTVSETDTRLHAAIGRASQLSLQQNMLTLSLLPKLLRSSSNASSSQQSVTAPTSSTSTVTRMTYAATSSSSSSSLSSSQIGDTSHGKQDKGVKSVTLSSDTPASPVMPDKPTASMLRETLSVLREQRERVAAYLLEANEHRKFEDVSTLQTSLDELEMEITRIHNQLRDI
ncbi:hypothetical protein BDF22DRAFT_89627 [Syncephalis plumigaleata]|nr:hypothetical protein BDF22DRAFT_89627 [Syncephalis plumigaleata]